MSESDSLWFMAYVHKRLITKYFLNNTVNEL